MAQVGIMESEHGLMKFTSASELERQKDEKILEEREIENTTPSTLASYVRNIFDSAKRAKIEVEDVFLCLLRRLEGEYDPDKLAALRDAGMPEDFFQLTNKKARDLEGWLWEVYNQFGERTWDIKPQYEPELDPELQSAIEEHVRMSIMQHPEVQQALMQAQQTGQPVNADSIISLARKEAMNLKGEVLRKARQEGEERTTNMEKKIQDILVEGGYYDALKACINDLSRFKSCIMKGPIRRKKKVLGEWYQDSMGKWKVKAIFKVIQCFYRVSPFDWYPNATSTGVQDGETCEIEHFRNSDLQEMIDVPGYDAQAIKDIMAKFPFGFSENQQVAPERFYLEHDNSTGFNDPMAQKVDSVDFYGNVPGDLLIEWGMTKEEIPDRDITYPVNIKMVSDIVYRSVLNPDPLGEKPYGVTSFLKSNDSQWGTAPAEIGADVEDFCNNVIRNMTRNISESAGPMAEVNIDRLDAGESPDRWPGKTFVTTSKAMTEGPAIRYYQAELKAQELWTLYEKAALVLDGIIVPSFGQGSSLTKGGGRTASGLAMIANAESRNLKVVVSNVDDDIQIPVVKKVFQNLMMFDDDDSVKGPMRVKPRGVAAQLVKESQTVRQGEFLKGTMNSVDAEIIGKKGRAYMLFKAAENLGYDPYQVIPEYEQIEKEEPGAMAGVQQASAQAAQLPGPAKADASGAPMSDYHQGAAK